MSESKWQRRDRKRNQKAKDATMRGNRDWQHAQVRGPKRRSKGKRRAAS